MENQNYKVALTLALQDCDSGKVKPGLRLLVGATPPRLLAAGLPQLPLEIYVTCVDKVHYEHGITKSVLERLYALLGDPEAIFKSATQDGVVVVTVETKGGHPVVVAIHPSKKVGRHDQVNLIASIYAKEDPKIQERWKKEGLLLWKK